MNNKPKISIVLGLIVIIGISFASGLFVGNKTSLLTPKVYGHTFYATIESIKQYNDGSIHITAKGLEINDINYRNDFTFKVDDSIKITWIGGKLKASDLKIGNNISITFTDEIITTVIPTPLKEVVEIQVLDDEI